MDAIDGRNESVMIGGGICLLAFFIGRPRVLRNTLKSGFKLLMLEHNILVVEFNNFVFSFKKPNHSYQLD